MPHQDYTVNPSVTSFFEREIEELPLLKPGKAGTIDFSIEFGENTEPALVNVQTYESEKIYTFAYKLMEKLRITYEKQDNKRKLEDFSDEEKKLLYPFASFLAILDGNCFDDFIEQYMPDAYSILTNNTRSMEEMIARIQKE